MERQVWLDPPPAAPLSRPWQITLPGSACMNVVWRYRGLSLTHPVSKHMTVLESFQPLSMCPYALLFIRDKKGGSRRMQLETISELTLDSVCSVWEFSTYLQHPVFLFWVWVFPLALASHIYSLFCGTISCRLIHMANNLPPQEN